ncbi:hypothetical protein [Rickettsia endosymbiont of Polydrusus tereticollis]|uniref:hypothetical protein n=1 Tax=Rickettsia endosymbiont of Polydrusus tereticollis TaxID=3066251 RepID=UPI0031332361
MFLKFVFFLFVTFFYINSYAMPVPISLELNKATVDDIIKKYKITKKEPNYWQGYNYFIDIKDVNLEKISRALVICNDFNIVEAVILTIDKNKFEEFYTALTSKYMLVKQDIKPEGNKSATFINDGCSIILEAPEFSVDMELTYVTDNFYKKFLEKLEQEEKLQQEQIKNLL